MASVTDFRSVISDYLLDSIDRHDFARRISELLIGVRKHRDESVFELACGIEFRLGELASGLISEKEFRFALGEFSVETKVSKKFRAAAVEGSVVKESSSSPYRHSELVFTA